ncbi:MAG: signal recognition particle protein [Anaerolineae bacterium]|nr:signal recognition particle protein [Anaerolineae bacterium]NIO00102.1 signal recognition particle protein [Anaerolineae bacterium]NIQ80517.1 signal recognition particle protein [Anaerolineae bacterium]
MFEALTEKLQGTFDRLARKGRLTEQDVDEALREVRIALLEADVNFKVVKEFVARVRERAVGAEVMRSLTPAQQVVKIVNEELIALLGEPSKLDLSGQPPHGVMLVGLQGSGKTTTAAKLALHIRKQGQRPLLVAADTRRPAAVQQLEILGTEMDLAVHSEGTTVPPPEICAHALKRAKEAAYSVVIMDTQGRLHVDDQLMAELEQVKGEVSPAEILLVADAMTGQDAVRVAQEFHERVGLSGLILTKMDGDARGGAALSMRSVTGVPIKFLGTGEKSTDLESFHPDRLASRILGMGDVLTLIERAEEAFDQEQALEMEEKLRTATFTLEDFLDQLQQVKKMGPMSQLLDMIPGLSSLAGEIPAEVTDKQLVKIEAMINSMTPTERQNPRVIGGSRKRRIARGSGTTVQDLNQLLSQFRQMQKIMKQVSKGRMPDLSSMFR